STRGGPAPATSSLWAPAPRLPYAPSCPTAPGTWLCGPSSPRLRDRPDPVERPGRSSPVPGHAAGESGTPSGAATLRTPVLFSFFMWQCPVSTAGDRDGAAALGRFLDCKRNGQRARPIDAVHDRPPLPPHPARESFERYLVEIAAVGDLDLVFAGAVAQRHLAPRILGHYVDGNDRALFAVHLETRSGVGDSERVVGLDEDVAFVAQRADHRVLRHRSPRALPDRHGRRLQCVAPQNRAHGCGVVAGDVEDHAGAASLPGEPPPLQPIREVPRVKDAHRERPSDRSVRDELTYHTVRCRGGQVG